MARRYDPVLGRFIQPDTIVPDPGDPQALNRYSYVGNNPVRYTDPSGHCVEQPSSSTCAIRDNCPSGYDLNGMRPPDKIDITARGDAYAKQLAQALHYCASFGCTPAVIEGLQHEYQPFLLRDPELGQEQAYMMAVASGPEMVDALLGLGVGVILIDPAELRWTQRTAGGRGRADILRESLSRRGWEGPPIDVVETPEGMVTVDHTRAAVALELNLGKIPARVHQPSDPITREYAIRRGFIFPDGRVAATWGEAIAARAARQRPPLPPTGTSIPPRLP